MKKHNLKQIICAVLCLAMLLGFNMGFAPEAFAAGIDVGANPTPKVDIAVNVPADYPGTFLDFKQELTEKLIAQGMSPSDFRITTTAVTIDTTDTSGWIVYDHYRDDDAYKAAIASGKISADPSIAPKRIADNTYTNGSDLIENYFPNGKNETGNACKKFDRHILSSQDADGKASMVFVGYGTQALTDFMIYPAASNARRNFSFDINPAVIDTHTLASYGFFLNAGISGGNVKGYALYFTNGHVGSIRKINVAASGQISGSPVASNLNMGIKTGDVVRLTVELNKDSVTIQYQKYVNGNLSEPVDLLKNFQLDDTGFNGFGPFVNYSSHGCSSLSIMKYSDLEMSYEASAFDALKNVQYYEGAEQKYFINLTGTNNNPGIPEELKNGEPNQNYRDGINRMNEKEIFYISNTDDGQIVTDSNKDANHQGLGSANGFYASGDAYVDLIAQYIATNHFEGVKFQQQEVESQLPLANFYIKDARTEDEQMMTIHLQHLVNNNETVPVNIVDRSKTGTLSGADGTLTKWTLTVTDPNNKVVGTQTVSDPAALKDYVFTASSVSGRYTLTLVVEDSKGNVSKDFSTYITAFLDNEYPFIEGENTGRNIATITLTDTGAGIDEDGITFIEDGRGSGVAAYFVTNDPNYTPTEDDWIVLPFAQHQYSFEQEITSTEPLVVWTRDECDNVGNKAVFQPTYVRVEDQDGNPIDDYYVIGDVTIVDPDGNPDDKVSGGKPIIVLPPDEDVPDPEDPDDYFSGWVTPGNDPVTPGTVPEPEDNVIVIRPNYAKDYAKMVYLANGGKISTVQGEKDSVEYQVVDKASIYTKIEDHNVVLSRTGYSFDGWLLLKSDKPEDAANAANLEKVSTQQAIVEKHKDEDGKDVIDRDTYYLVAQWKEGEYTLRLNPNGGAAGNVKSIENVKYGTDVGTLNIPVSGRGIPSRAGYFFRGWSVASNNKVDNMFKVATGYSHAAVAAPTMPASDLTVYAVWEQDTSKYIVSFDSNGGSSINDQAYGSAATNYDPFMKPSRTGYTFEGWYEKLTDTEGNVTMGTTAYSGGEIIIHKGNNHSFIAKWSPKTDTKYTVDYYFNSGNVAADGSFIYTKATNNQSKTYIATTEETVTVKDEDKLSEITVNGETYWFNADSTNNIFSGTVTGSPALSLKLYYDRYFTVNTSSNGNGTVEIIKKDDGTVTVGDSLLVKEGNPGTVKWTPKEGYYVSRVVVDGAVRDDLLNVTEYTFPTGFYENHRVYVAFTSNDIPKDPVNPGPVAPEDRYYSVSTSVVGCSDDSKYFITPSTSAKAGSDVKIDWGVSDSQYFVSKVEIDGVEENSSYTSFSFSKISADHDVKITLSTLPTIGGTTVENAYTVTVNRYGGGGKVTVSDSQVVKEGKDATVSWNVNDSDYRVLKVMVDGKAVNLRNDTNGSRNFNNISANHVVDVYFTKPNEKTPDFNSDQDFIQVTTQLVGAPGTITGGAVIEKGNDYDVNWDVVTSDAPPESDQYFYYEIEKVEINGVEQIKSDDNNVALTEISEDTDVKVYVKPVLQRVTILKYGEGTVSPSKTVYYNADYTKIGAKAASGWSLARIDVDGKTEYSVEVYEINATIEGGDDTCTITGSGKVVSGGNATVAWNVDSTKFTVEEVTINGEAKDNLKTAASIDFTNITANQTVVVKLAPVTPTTNEILSNDAQTNEPTGEQADAQTGEQADAQTGEQVDAQPDEQVDAQADEQTDAQADESTSEEGTPLVVEEIGYNGAKRVIRLKTLAFEDDTKAADAAAAPSVYDQMTSDSYAQTAIIEDHVIIVYFTKDETDADGNPVTDPDGKPIPTPITDDDIKELKKVNVKVEGGPAAVSEGNAVVNAGGKADVAWKLLDPTNYEIESVTVNGTPVEYTTDESKPDAPYSFALTGITADQNVVITLKQKPVDKHEEVLKPTITRTTYDVTTEIKGKGGSISNGGSVVPGTSKTIKWTVEPGAEVRYVFVNGEPRTDLLNAGEVTLGSITENQSVIVYLAKPGEVPTNVDKDGDGTPDINKDTDNDGVPDLDIDTDDDGIPDVNIDTDGDGKPDVNIDTNGDLIPDKNIDTNGDGIPDKNIISDHVVIATPTGSVQTGDVDLSIMLFVMLASAAGLVVLLSKRLRRE